VGRLSGAAGEERLTGPLWHDGPLDALAPDGERPVVWSVRLDSDAAAAALALVPHQGLDLADFAAAPDAGHRLLRRRLTRALLGRTAGVPAEAILFGRAAAGAPSVLSPKGWYVSVAGRAPLCLIAVSRASVGVDVEPLDDAVPLLDMLTPKEAAWIASLPAAEQPREWLRYWCAKEAHAKRLGCARHADPAAIEICCVAGRIVAASGLATSRLALRHTGGRIEAVAMPQR
jgi:4'-phosphopantetheinyl transferase